MSEFHTAVRDYLAVRRRLGFTLRDAGWLLPDFADFMREKGSARITTQLALAWATQPAGASPVWWRQRLGVVRGFARYLKTIESSTEIPSRDLLPAVYNRITPYLYSPADVAALMGAARSLLPTLRGATYQTLIGLLAVSGLRIGEVIRLAPTDIDGVGSVLLVRHSKGDSAREVPLHTTALRALHAYADKRDSQFPQPRTQSFFVSIRGTRLSQSAVNATFRELVLRTGLEQRGPRCRPRIHDLRHSLAVTTLLDWYEQGADVDAKLPLLSTVLGHVNPASTYWYLQAVPQLLALACRRLEAVPDQDLS